MMVRRVVGGVVASVLALSLVVASDTAGAAADKASAALRAGGHVVMIRYTNAPPGCGGDPPGFRLDDGKTQRNLDERGREEARLLTEAFRENGVKV